MFENGNPISNTPSPELALLAACDLADDRSLVAAVSALRPGFDWARFGRLALAHDMAGLVGARLVPLCNGQMPAELADLLTSLRRAEYAMSVTQIELTARLCAALDADGTSSIVLKGTALGHLLYAPHPEWRTSLDIDILVAPEHLLRAEAVLLREGLTSGAPVHAIPDCGRDMLMLLQNAGDYIVPRSGQLVELHHRICRNPGWIDLSFQDLLQQTVLLETAAGPIRSLSGPALVSHLCWHALSHFGYRLKWICDVARALRHFGAPSCTAYAAGPGQGRHLALADSVLAMVLDGTHNPPQGSARWSRRARAILAALEDPQDIPTRRTLALLPRELAYRRLLMQISPTWRAKAFEVFDLLTDPRDVAVLGLGRRFAAVYAALGPLFALRRMVRSRGEDAALAGSDT